MMQFLEVASIREDLDEVLRSARQLKELIGLSHEQRSAREQAKALSGELTTVDEEIEQHLQVILERAEATLAFLDRFESGPIIYTGRGTTQEVLSRLHRLAALAESLGEEL